MTSEKLLKLPPRLTWSIAESKNRHVRNGKVFYPLIYNHTARKTFITNSIMLGMNTKTIKEITGHKKDAVFNKYVKISEDFKKLEMERTWNSIPDFKKKTETPKK